MEASQNKTGIEVFSTGALLDAIQRVDDPNLAQKELERLRELGLEQKKPKIDTAEQVEDSRELRLELFATNEPALTIDLTDEDVELVAELLIEGKSIKFISEILNLNAPQTRIAVKSQRVKARVDEKTAEMVRASSVKIKSHAMNAVNKLLYLLENSSNDKITLAAAKELIRLAGVGEETADEKSKTAESMAEKSNEKLLAIMQTLVGGPNG